ncbi:hypothetical protein BMW22_39930 (plasmid) [Rhizobium leguminosarum]|uniref:Uncharacterized protein n=1 Tax=Rhizobium leguminosarum TaxID=384 RepID=A0A1L3ZPM5_RHILE|nr:hypothetical protein BMW22_39930 [Rhizobium leguminosarum]
MLVQTFGAEAAVECFDEGIVRRLSWVRRMISKRTTRVFDIRASRLNPEKGWDSTLRRSRARSDLVLRETCAARPCRCRGDAGPGADGEDSRSCADLHRRPAFGGSLSRAASKQGRC